MHGIIALLKDKGEEIKLDAFVSYTNIELLRVILKWLNKIYKYMILLQK